VFEHDRFDVADVCGATKVKRGLELDPRDVPHAGARKQREQGRAGEDSGGDVKAHVVDRYLKRSDHVDGQRVALVQRSSPHQFLQRRPSNTSAVYQGSKGNLEHGGRKVHGLSGGLRARRRSTVRGKGLKVLENIWFWKT